MVCVVCMYVRAWSAFFCYMWILCDVFAVWCVLLHVLDVCVNEDYITQPRWTQSRYDMCACVSLWFVCVARSLFVSVIIQFVYAIVIIVIVGVWCNAWVYTCCACVVCTSVHFKWISLHFFLRVVCVSFERVFSASRCLSYLMFCAVLCIGARLEYHVVVWHHHHQIKVSSSLS